MRDLMLARKVKMYRDSDLTFQEIGDKFGFSRQRAQQIYKEVIEKGIGIPRKYRKRKKVKLENICESCMKEIEGKDWIDCEDDDENIIIYHYKCWLKELDKVKQ